MAFATWFLSRDGARYRRLLSTIDSTLIELTQLAAKRGIDSQEHGVAVSTFDVISGLSGVGRYLLLRADGATAHRVALESVLRFVVALAGKKDGVPHWHTPKEFIADENSRRFYPHGNLNCGLAHGVAGPLALLSVAAIRGAHVERQMQAIRGMADILLGYQIRMNGG